MIGSIKGIISHKKAPFITVECAGLGYEIETPMSTFLDLPTINTEVFLYTHMIVREDSQTLFGFSSIEEKDLFKTLLKVNGVGAKLGLAILSSLSVSDFQNCVQYDDTNTLIKIPGVGLKTAERLIIEMRDRIIDIGVIKNSISHKYEQNEPRKEAFDALISLGYKSPEVKKLLSNCDSTKLSAEEMIRLALKKVAS
tara:strand:+ start:2622 stop:3212 length:591 start_codon:yes stop_codon:yes gene_type:complete